MKIYRLFIFFVFSIALISCKKDNDNPINNDTNDTIPAEVLFSVNEHYILKNDIPFQVRGVVYVPGYPGHMPWDTEVSVNLPAQLNTSIAFDLYNIQEMGANTVRFWGSATVLL
jgi:hypothetical protein